jgi:hypothetical protein
LRAWNKTKKKKLVKQQEDVHKCLHILVCLKVISAGCDEGMDGVDVQVVLWAG